MYNYHLTKAVSYNFPPEFKKKNPAESQGKINRRISHEGYLVCEGSLIPCCITLLFNWRLKADM